MKYARIVAFLAGLISGAAGGYYYGKKREAKKAEKDVATVIEEFDKKLAEARKQIAEQMTKDEENDEKLTQNGDIDDSNIVLIRKEEYGYDPNYRDEDITYYANDKVWYNQDLEKTYNQNNPKESFCYPSDLFSHFGVGEGKSDYVYLADHENKVYYCLSYSTGSYVTEVLGYDSKEV